MSADRRRSRATRAYRASVEIYDTTLRDGSQLEGISLTVEDKLRIAEQLDWLGVRYIEAGCPGANPKDDEFFRRAPHRAAAHDRRRWWPSGRPGGRRARSTATTRCAAWSRPNVGTVCIVGKAWDYHVHRGAADHARRGRGDGRRLGRVPAGARACRCSSTPSTSSTATSATPSSRCACSRRRPWPAPTAWCCATPTAARCRTRSSASSPRSCAYLGGDVPVGVHPTTTPAARWPTRWPGCAAAPPRCRARSTATASAPATATSRRSSRTSR